MGFWTNFFGLGPNYSGETPNPANPPGPVGDAAATGDPDGAEIVDDPTFTGDLESRSLPWLMPSPWSGWPDSWSTPNWSMGGIMGAGGGLGPYGGWPGMSRLIDTAWAALDLNASVLASFPAYRLRNGVVLSSPTYLTNPDPATYASWFEFMKQVMWDFQLGEVFIMSMAEDASRYPLRFRVIPPWLVQVKLVEGMRQYELCGEDVTDVILHIRYLSNTAYAHGYGPLEAAGGRMVTAGLLQRYANKLAETGGTPHHWLDVPGRKLKPEESNELLDAWMESRLRHAGGPSVLSGGVELKQANSMNARDLALLELAQFTESRVAILCGVPPFLLGLPMAQGESITYSNASTLFDYHDRASLRPKATAVMSALSGWLLPRGQSVELNREEYSRPGMLERAQANQIYLATGVLDKGEVRAMERFDGVPSAAAALTGAETVGDPLQTPEPEPAPAPPLDEA